MLYQTKEAKNRMIAAGFARKDVKVTTPFDRNVGGYGDPVIVCHASKNEMVARIDACLANGINVTLVLNGNAGVHYPMFALGRKEQGILQVLDSSQSFDSGKRWMDFSSLERAADYYGLDL